MAFPAPGIGSDGFEICALWLPAKLAYRAARVGGEAAIGRCTSRIEVAQADAGDAASFTKIGLRIEKV